MMTKGFFIKVNELKSPRKTQAAIGMKWAGVPVEVSGNWEILYSQTIDGLLGLHQEKFLQRRDASESLPYLVSSDEMLPACGRMIRFVEITA